MANFVYSMDVFIQMVYGDHLKPLPSFLIHSFFFSRFKYDKLYILLVLILELYPLLLIQYGTF